MICLNAVSFTEQITLGQISVCLVFIVGLIGAISKLKKILEDWTTKQVKPMIDAMNVSFKKELDDMRSEVNKLKVQVERQDLENVKNYLVLFLADIDRNSKPNEIELARFDEEMKYYESKGGNSYIHRAYERLKQEGKL